MRWKAQPDGETLHVDGGGDSATAHVIVLSIFGQRQFEPLRNAVALHQHGLFLQRLQRVPRQPGQQGLQPQCFVNCIGKIRLAGWISKPEQARPEDLEAPAGGPGAAP